MRLPVSFGKRDLFFGLLYKTCMFLQDGFAGKGPSGYLIQCSLPIIHSHLLFFLPVPTSPNGFHFPLRVLINIACKISHVEAIKQPTAMQQSSNIPIFMGEAGDAGSKERVPSKVGDPCNN